MSVEQVQSELAALKKSLALVAAQCRRNAAASRHESGLWLLLAMSLEEAACPESAREPG